MRTTKTALRKSEHITLALTEKVSFRTKTTGFERWDFKHNALPELNLSQIQLTTDFLGKQISMPFIISSMTGGYAKAEAINKLLAEICDEKNIGLGIGSQRQALEDNQFVSSFSIVRKIAPSIPIYGNIGAVELVKLNDVSSILELIEMIEADGFAIHLNPLQELLQPEGSPNFYGVLSAIERLAKEIPVPIIVKEVGAGISKEVATQLINAGVRIIDIAGAGGTSWAGIEITRKRNGAGKNNSAKKLSTKYELESLDKFWDWGIPTVDALREVCVLKSNTSDLKIIASGGISNGIDIAKSIAFGADYTASARVILNALSKNNKGSDKGKKNVIMLLNTWESELKKVMFLTGSKSIADLKKQKLIERNKN